MTRAIEIALLVLVALIAGYFAELRVRELALLERDVEAWEKVVEARLAK